MILLWEEKELRHVFTIYRHKKVMAQEVQHVCADIDLIPSSMKTCLHTMEVLLFLFD